MSTRAIIAMEEDGEQFTAVYLRFDGYVRGAGATLAGHYATADRARQLLALGDLRVLRQELGEAHSFGDDRQLAAARGWCTAYHRDLGDKWERAAPLTFSGRRYFEQQVMELMEYWFYEWAYLFRDGRWLAVDLTPYCGQLPAEGLGWTPLADLLAEINTEDETC